MSRGSIIGLSIGGFVILVALYVVSAGNTLVRMDESVTASWAQVENVYQRRADLIPNLVNTVKGYAKHEASVLEEVTKARASVGQIRVNDANSLKSFDKNQGQLTQALSRLMVVAEKYPELKADKNFLELQSQLEGTENRISTERHRFNEAAQEYNTQIRLFPSSIIAGMKNLKEHAYFAAEQGAKVAPKVSFE